MTGSTDFRVTLLGTGMPIPSPDRFGPSTLVEAGDQKLLVDAGRGADDPAVSARAFRSGGSMCCSSRTITPTIPPAFPDLWLTGWLESHFGTRTTP